MSKSKFQDTSQKKQTTPEPNTQIPVSSPETVSTPQEIIAMIGEHLKQARFKSGLSLTNIASRLKLSEKKLAAIETGALKISNLTYMRAVLRGYAKILNTDIDKELASLSSLELKITPKSEDSHTQYYHNKPITRPIPIRKLLWVISIVGIISLAIYLIWAKFDQLQTVIQTKTQILDSSPGSSMAIDTINSLRSPPSPVIDNAALNQLTETSNTTSTTASLSTTIPQQQRLTIKFTGTSWYEVRDAQDILLASGIENAGSIKEIHTEPPIKLTLGNAQETIVEFQGRPIGLAPSENGVAHLTLK